MQPSGWDGLSVFIGDCKVKFVEWMSLIFYYVP